MGAFDKPVKLTDRFPHGTRFVWLAGEYHGRVKTAEFGENQQATVTAAPEDEPQNRRDFTVWGVMADQVRRLDPDDLPAVCVIGKDGQSNVIEKVADGVAGDEPNF